MKPSAPGVAAREKRGRPGSDLSCESIVGLDISSHEMDAHDHDVGNMSMDFMGNATPPSMGKEWEIGARTKYHARDCPCGMAHLVSQRHCAGCLSPTNGSPGSSWSEAADDVDRG